MRPTGANILLVSLLLFVLCPTPVESNFRLCGARLTSMLNSVCNGCFRPPRGSVKLQLVKRATPTIDDWPDDPILRWFSQRTKRNDPTVGVADKCCTGRCTMSDIRRYCCN
uniref:Insulin-like domain-containing protein n=1 Tax=Plectus sambesii TaxID=2011161 RepID=A0A914WUC1_9BILA